MKKIYCFLLSLVIFSFLGFTSIGSAQIIEYKVTSGGKSVTLTHDYELDAGSSAHSHIDVSTDPSISSNTQLQGGMDAYIRGQTGDDMADVYMVMEDGDTSQVSTQVTPTHSASISASGSALMGVVRAVSGDSRCFCPFSGNFQAEGTAGGRQANTSSTYSDARADIRVVTHGDANHCCHCFPEDRIYKNQPTSALQQAVEATPDAGPSWVLVDEGQYEGAEIGNKTNLNLCGVWGQEDTTINGRSEGGSTLYVHDSPGFYISGLTIEGGNQTGDEAGELGCGLEARRCENIIIEENTVQNNERAIGVWSSNNAEIGGNTVQNNERAIGVLDSNNTQIVGNTIQNNTLGGIYVEDSSNDTQIEGNTIQNNESGIHVWSSNNTQIKENTVQNSEYGICVVDSNSTQIEGNTIRNNNLFGISVWESTGTEAHWNNIYENTEYGLYNFNSEPPYAVDAEDNWWGCAGGPGSPGCDNVTDNVDYDPWSTTPFPIGGEHDEIH